MIETANTTRGFVHVKRRIGHRGAYQDLFGRFFGLAPTQGPILRHLKGFVTAPRVLFATLDGQEVGFIMVGLLRGLLGRPTIGLFLRPQSCFHTSLKAKAKLALFVVARRMPGIRILTIIPFAVEPRYAQIATGWIHDPQLWDLAAEERLSSVPETDLSRRVVRAASGRPVLSFIGTIRRSKGSHFLRNALAATPGWNRRFLVVLAGKVSEDAREDARFVEANGGLVIDRVIENEELESLYPVSGYIWCCYDPAYDQASGIFGRAVQFGRTAIIRDGSLLHRMIKAEPALGEAIAYDPGAPLYLTGSNGSSGPVAREKGMADLALRTIRDAWGAA